MFTNEEIKNFDIKVYKSEELKLMLKLMKEFIEKCRNEWEKEWNEGKRSYFWEKNKI